MDLRLTSLAFERTPDMLLCKWPVQKCEASAHLPPPNPGQLNASGVLQLVM
jgi:hypothetical protein